LTTGGPERPPPTEAEHFRQLAAGARAMAEKFTDPDLKEAMLNVAASYDRLADSAEWHPAPPIKTRE